MAKIELDVETLESKLNDIAEELEKVSGELQDSEPESEAAVKVIKQYQKLLDRNTYLLVQLANAKLGVNAISPRAKAEASDGEVNEINPSDTAVEGSSPSIEEEDK